MSYVDKRYEFVVLFDVENGNPNGDPDAGNMPRIDFETGHGIVTDVCLKRKVRNYVEIAKNEGTGYRIYVKEGSVLNSTNEEAYKHYGLDTSGKNVSKDQEQQLTIFMCENFYDIRTFGAVMTTKVNCGQVRGAVQFNFAKSIDPIMQQEVTITRMAVTNEKDAEKERAMGRKHIVPYALYRAEGYVSAFLAEKTHFTQEDLELLWEAVINMFEHDHSAARGKMAVRNLIVFEHQSALGNSPAHKLFDLIQVERKDKTAPARAYTDYQVTINRDDVPNGVTLIEKL